MLNQKESVRALSARLWGQRLLEIQSRRAAVCSEFARSPRSPPSDLAAACWLVRHAQRNVWQRLADAAICRIIRMSRESRKSLKSVSPRLASPHMETTQFIVALAVGSAVPSLIHVEIIETKQALYSPGCLLPWACWSEAILYPSPPPAAYLCDLAGQRTRCHHCSAPAKRLQAM